MRTNRSIESNYGDDDQSDEYHDSNGVGSPPFNEESVDGSIAFGSPSLRHQVIGY